MRSSAQSPNTSQSNTDSRAYRHGRLSHGAVSTRRGSRHLRTIPRCTNFLHSPVRPNSARATSSPKSAHCAGHARRSLDPAQRSLFKPRMIIAIDGPAASGKGTLGKRLAAHFGLRHLDTGLLYRAVAKALLDAGRKLDDRDAAIAAAKALDPAKFDEKVLKDHAVGEAASIVSAIPEVRDALLAFQREFAAAPPGAVLDGRDIGTVICPHAHAKIFVIADAEVRARRRAAELRSAGQQAGDAAMLADIQ